MIKIKDEKRDKEYNLLELSIDNSRCRITPFIIKLILILIFIILFFLIIGVTVFALVSQLNIIKGLTSQIQDLSTQIINDIPLLKGKVDSLISLTNQINKVELLLSEKDKEIQSLKAITNNLILSTYNYKNLNELYFFVKDKNFKIFWENVKNLNYLEDLDIEKINFLEKELKNNRDEILLLKDKIQNLNIMENNNDEQILTSKADDKINNKNNKLIENIGNFKKFDSLRDIINKTEIEQNNYLESFESIQKAKSNLINFKIKININSDNEDKQLYLCYHNNNINNSKYFDYILIADENIKNKCEWNIIQLGDLFIFENNMNKCKIQIKENDVICSNESNEYDYKRNTFSLEKDSNDKYFKIKEVDSGQYLFLDTINKSSLSYFISLTKNKNIASEFNFMK